MAVFSFNKYANVEATTSSTWSILGNRGELAAYSSSHILVILQMFEEFMQHTRISIKEIFFSFIVKINSAIYFKNIVNYLKFI